MTDLLAYGQSLIEDWEREWPPFTPDDSTLISDSDAQSVLRELGGRLRNYPYFHPSYAGQMLKPPHEIARAAYAMAQRINPNNHALDGGPATGKLERELIGDLASLFGFDPGNCLGHLTSSGTIANLEALWIARELHPEKGIAYSSQAHYTHSRISAVIGMAATSIGADGAGRMNLEELRAALEHGGIGTIVATAGTTSIGAVDPILAIQQLAAEYGARVHVDAAYGGFFRLLAQEDDGALAAADAAAFRAIATCDSIVVDPHKHGLQPYGCGSVLFRDPAVGRFYVHDSPYTYFTSNELHLGEISLECSRAGAAAAALWATLRCFPLLPEIGLGPILRRSRLAAIRWADLIETSEVIRLVTRPALDIVAAYPLPSGAERRASRISELTREIFATGMRERSYYLATLRMSPGSLTDMAHHDLVWDQSELLVLRSDLMKPEHLDFVDELHRRVTTAISAG